MKLLVGVISVLLVSLIAGVKEYEPLDVGFMDGKCRAISFEGNHQSDVVAGGVKGAYEIGALKALIDNLPAKDVAYDVVSGVSVGSINSAGMSIFKKGDEKNAIDFLCRDYLS